MSAATASSTETVTIFVRLLHEGTDVWRPVPARRLSEATYRLGDSPIPADEAWSFQPGDIVVAEHRVENGVASTALFAVARATDFDTRSQSVFSLTG
jgi:hypothetical protein